MDFLHRFEVLVQQRSVRISLRYCLHDSIRPSSFAEKGNSEGAICNLLSNRIDTAHTVLEGMATIPVGRRLTTSFK